MFESGKSQATDIKEFFGTYKGFTPIDDGILGYGELELTINESQVSFSKATGSAISVREFPTSMLVPLTKAKTRSYFQQGIKNIDTYSGFQANGNQYIFIPNATDEEFGLVILGYSANMRGPTIMFSPSQIIAGTYETLFRQIGNFIPQLIYDGKIPPEKN